MSFWSSSHSIGNRVTKVTLFLFCLAINLSCSPSARQLFFDITPPTAEELAEKARLEQAQLGLGDQPEQGRDSPGDKSFTSLFGDDAPRPEIESVQTWEEALEMLPKDYKDGADWVEAVKRGVIRPRAGADARSLLASSFKYDFILPADNPKNEAYFPHSAHTSVLGCENCHQEVFPYKRNPATMKEMRAGASCGACHGSVAFSLRLCKRCHLNR